MTIDHGPTVRADLEKAAFEYYDDKRDDPLNLDLGSTDGYHHHFAVGDVDRTVLTLDGDAREEAINLELHRMETRQVNVLAEALGEVPATARLLNEGSGRGGTAHRIPARTTSTSTVGSAWLRSPHARIVAR